LEGDWNSVCVASDGSYETKEGLITSFPIRSDGENWEIVQGVPVNEFARGKIDASVNELAEERELVSNLLPS
jgi:malate dehydrogenase